MSAPVTGPTPEQLAADPCPLRFGRPVDGFYRVWQRKEPATEWTLGRFTAHNLTDRLSLPGAFSLHKKWITRHFRVWSKAKWPDGTIESAPKEIDWRAFGQWVRDQCLAADGDEPADIVSPSATLAATPPNQVPPPTSPTLCQAGLSRPAHQPSGFPPVSPCHPPDAGDAPLPSSQLRSGSPNGSTPPSLLRLGDQPSGAPSFVEEPDRDSPAGPTQSARSEAGRPSAGDFA